MSEEKYQSGCEICTKTCYLLGILLLLQNEGEEKISTLSKRSYQIDKVYDIW